MSLFLNIKYHLSSSLSATFQSDLTAALDNNKAICAESLAEATHIITDSFHFEGWKTVNDNVAIVTPAWVNRSMVLGKLQPTEGYSADPGMIFSGVVACAAELPLADLEVLSAGITSFGGQWRNGLTKDVTHLFALSPNSDKYRTAMHFKEQTQIKVLLPHWFDDAVKLVLAGTDTRPYEWPDPPYLKPPAPGQRSPKKQRKLDPDKRALLKTAAGSDNVEIDASNIKDVWQDRRILLSLGLELTPERRETVNISIERAQGRVVAYHTNDGVGSAEEEVDKIDECDIFITGYRTGKAYFKAARVGKTIGTLSWLFHVHSKGVISRPMDQLLHYPVPKKPIEKMKNEKMTITNYTGEAREYLKKLIHMMGASFTPSMTIENTVLISAYEDGTKVSKARQWRLTVVNHLWLEDCFAQWQWLSPADNRYINFPPGVDWVTNVGSRVVDRSLEDPDQLDQAEAEELEAEDALIPIGTENSARDAREVAEFINGDPDEDVIDNEVLRSAPEESQPSKTPGTPKAGVGSKTSHKQSTRPTRTAETMEEIDDFGDIPGVQKQARLLRHTKGKLPSPSLDDDTDNATNRSSRRKKEKAPVSVNGNESKVENKEKPTSTVDSDSDFDNSPIVILSPPNTRSGKLKTQTISPVAPPMQAKQGRPYKVSTTPTKTSSKSINETVTVSMTKSSGSSKSVIKPAHSIQVVAAERPAREPSSPMKVKQAADSIRGRSRRSAATKAEQRLRDEVMPDVNNFEQERRNKRRKSGVGTSSSIGTQKLSHEDFQVPNRRRKGKTLATEEDEDDDDDGRVTKRRRLSTSTELDMTEDELANRKRGQSTASSVEDTAKRKVNLVVTQTKLSDDVMKVLTKLGVRKSERASECTHLIAPHIVRTEKFLCALTAAPYIVTEKWATDSAVAKKLLSEDLYILRDKQGEKKFSFTLSESLTKARSKKMFHGCLFYITPHVSVKFDVLKNVVEACGGQITTIQANLRNLTARPNRYVISCPEDEGIWKPLLPQHKIYLPEFLLTGALKQEAEWNNTELMVPGTFFE